MSQYNFMILEFQTSQGAGFVKAAKKLCDGWHLGIAKSAISKTIIWQEEKFGIAKILIVKSEDAIGNISTIENLSVAEPEYVIDKNVISHMFELHNQNMPSPKTWYVFSKLRQRRKSSNMVMQIPESGLVRHTTFVWKMQGHETCKL